MPDEQAPQETPTPVRQGEFVVVREVGRGGTGAVCEAEQPGLRHRVALKVLPPGLGRDAGWLARFQREAEAAGRPLHPDGVPAHGIGDAAGMSCFTRASDGRDNW